MVLSCRRDGKYFGMFKSGEMLYSHTVVLNATCNWENYKNSEKCWKRGNAKSSNIKNEEIFSRRYSS